MTKTGIVMKKEKNTALIMTAAGGFYKVSAWNRSPQIGEEFSGKVKKEAGFYKNFITAAILMFMVTTVGGAFAYYTPAAAITVDINPSIQLKTNIFDRIISAEALDSDGKAILGSIRVKNKSLNAGLNLIVKKSEELRYVNKSSGVIAVDIDAKNSRQLNIAEFEKYISSENLNAKIDNNGIKKEIKSKENVEKGKASENKPETDVNKSKSEETKPKATVKPEEKKSEVKPQPTVKAEEKKPEIKPQETVKPEERKDTGKVNVEIEKH